MMTMANEASLRNDGDPHQGYGSMQAEVLGLAAIA